MDSLQGKLLVASVAEPDPDFAGAVILLIQHSEAQAVGVMINRPSGQTVRDAWGKTAVEAPLYTGGPVPGPPMVVHTHEALGEIEILPGVFYSVKKASLTKLVRQTEGQLKVFDSHSGWGPGQLEQQIEAEGWIVVPATADEVFSVESGLWERLSGS